MIKITKRAMDELCEKLSIDQEKMTFLGGGREESDGTVYIYQEKAKKKVIKILAIPETNLEKLRELELRVKYANHLGEHGIWLAYPLRNEFGHLYETSIDNNHYYTAYVMEYCEGHNPESIELKDEVAKEWGVLTGKCHVLTKSFSYEKESCSLGHNSEIDMFTNWCKDADVKEVWRQMKKNLNQLPQGVNDYGFIHNDNHQRNILLNRNHMTLIDFDCATPQFLIHRKLRPMNQKTLRVGAHCGEEENVAVATRRRRRVSQAKLFVLQDIITPVQGIMFDITGGMVTPMKDKEPLKRFFDSFINGYESQNHLDNMWYERIPLFLNYRRMLLFTCMQGWLNTKQELYEGMKKMILQNV